MTKAERAIKEASQRVSEYKVNISKYPALASSRPEEKISSQAVKNKKKS